MVATVGEQVEVENLVGWGVGVGMGSHLRSLEYLDWEGEQGQVHWSEYLQKTGVVPVSSQTLDHSFSRRSRSHLFPLIANHYFFVSPL